MTVASTGEATRRMVDLSLILDVSSSLGLRWPRREGCGAHLHQRVRQGRRPRGADQLRERRHVLDAMSTSRGFDKAKVIADVATSLPGGSTAMVEGLYRGWDELRSVPVGSQSGLRVIVLFTDGASNSVPGIYPGSASARGLRTWDFPKNYPDPDPRRGTIQHIDGMYDTQSGVANACAEREARELEQLRCCRPHRDGSGAAAPEHTLALTQLGHSDGVSSANILAERQWRSAGQRARVAPQEPGGTGKFPAEIFNVNNAARNLVEIIADQARNDTGDYKIRIYTIGMGELVRYDLGTLKEKSEDILKRMANDAGPRRTSTAASWKGSTTSRKTEADVGPAFAALQSQIVRLTKYRREGGSPVPVHLCPASLWLLSYTVNCRGKRRDTARWGRAAASSPPPLRRRPAESAAAARS